LQIHFLHLWQQALPNSTFNEAAFTPSYRLRKARRNPSNLVQSLSQISAAMENEKGEIVDL